MAEIPPMTDGDWSRVLSSMAAIKEIQERKPQSGSANPILPPLPFPPGFAGEIAGFIYRAAPRPVSEVAVVAALGLLAGICGRQWQIPDSGLNVYLVLVARSAIGKEAMHSGVSALLKACMKQAPVARNFVDFSKHASGPALIKACVGNLSFVNVIGEIGHTLQLMAKAKPGDPSYTLREQWTTLYSKSGWTSIAGGLTYSNQDNNVSSVEGVSYSLIGETTPGKFHAALSSEMMEDGFMSRLSVIEYTGDRPDKNPAPAQNPPEPLVSYLVSIIAQADLLLAKDQYICLGRTDSVATKMEAFEKECDEMIRSTQDESRRQMWNRAALKAARIGGLLAVADNYLFPCIKDDHIDWAIGLVRRDIFTFTQRLENGDVGTGDDARADKLVAILKEYLLRGAPDSYKVPTAMWQNGIVGHNYLLQRTRNLSAFYDHKLGKNRALSDAIYSLMNAGYLMEVQKDKVVEAYSFHGKAYRVLRLPQQY